MACKDFNVPEGINTDEEWNEIRAWLRPRITEFREKQEDFAGRSYFQELTESGVCIRCHVKTLQ